MNRRTSPPTARRAQANSRCPKRPAASDALDSPRRGLRPNKGFLAVILVMQAAWIAFLAAMALLR
jgi:hypothetical protein